MVIVAVGPMFEAFAKSKSIVVRSERWDASSAAFPSAEASVTMR